MLKWLWALNNKRDNLKKIKSMHSEHALPVQNASQFSSKNKKSFRQCRFQFVKWGITLKLSSHRMKVLKEYDRTRERSPFQIILQSIHVETSSSDRCRCCSSSRQQLDGNQLHDYLFRICHSDFAWLDVRHFFLLSVAIDNSILVLVVYDNSWVKVWAALHQMWCTSFGFRFGSQFCCVDFQRKVNATNNTWGLAHAHARTHKVKSLF